MTDTTSSQSPPEQPASNDAVRKALARTLEPNGDNRDDGSNAFGLGVDWAQEQLLARYDALSPPPARQTGVDEGPVERIVAANRPCVGDEDSFRAGVEAALSRRSPVAKGEEG